jgi:hypothetical protein
MSLAKFRLIRAVDVALVFDRDAELRPTEVRHGHETTAVA